MSTPPPWPRTCPRCGQPLPAQSLRIRWHQTPDGPVTIRVLHCQVCGADVSLEPVGREPTP